MGLIGSGFFEKKQIFFITLQSIQHNRNYISKHDDGAFPPPCTLKTFRLRNSIPFHSKEQNMKAIEKSSIELYIKEIGSGTCSPLALRDEDELLRRASGGDEAARERIMKANLRYVVSVAKKYARGSVDLDDLVQAGNEALFESFETFDYGKFKKSGCSKFITYAGRRIC